MHLTKRRLLAAIAVFAAGVGVSVLPASAQQRTLVVTLLGGKTVTVTVDVPPGTPLDQITIPGITTPIIGISEEPQASPGPDTSTAPTTTTPPASTTPTVPSKPSKGGSGAGSGPPQPAAGGKKAQQHAEKTTGKAKGHAGAGPGGIPRAHVRNPSSSVAVPPSPSDPTFSLALPGAAPIGVPNFFIANFQVPPFLLPIYQAAGTQYDVPWQVLAAINEIETDYGRNLSVSTAGAVGWMQFLPSTWKRWGVDANHDGVKDPYNPVDAIFAAARYLHAAGAGNPLVLAGAPQTGTARASAAGAPTAQEATANAQLRNAIFAYNHAGWYVDSVMLRARLLAGLPADFVGSLTGLTQGRFPVAARATYADDLNERAATQRIARQHNVAVPVESNLQRHSIDIFSRDGAAVIAVQDGQVLNMGRSPKLGLYLRLRDVYGNTYTYGHLKRLAKLYPVPKPAKESAAKIARELKLPHDPRPTQPATAGRQVPRTPAARPHRTATKATARRAAPAAPAPGGNAPERLFAHPSRPAALRSGGARQLIEMGSSIPAGSSTETSLRGMFAGVFGLDRRQVVLKALRPGARVIGGTVLGRIGNLGDGAPHLSFAIRPAGRGAPQIDPKPILDGWKLLEATALYRADDRNPFFGPNGQEPTIGQMLLMSKEQLQQLVLRDNRVTIYSCGRRDIEAGQIDRRVLATLEFLADSGLNPTVSSLECGHSYLTTSGFVSEHSTGDAVDVAAVNGIPIAGHQGPGSIADITIRRLLTLQGTMKPHQIISLMTYPGTDNTLAMADHWNHIHIGFRPLFGQAAEQFDSVLRPKQWITLVARLNKITEPTVPLKPSPYALKVTQPGRATSGLGGE